MKLMERKKRIKYKDGIELCKGKKQNDKRL